MWKKLSRSFAKFDNTRTVHVLINNKVEVKRKFSNDE